MFVERDRTPQELAYDEWAQKRADEQKRAFIKNSREELQELIRTQYDDSFGLLSVEAIDHSIGWGFFPKPYAAQILQYSRHRRRPGPGVLRTIIRLYARKAGKPGFLKDWTTDGVVVRESTGSYHHNCCLYFNDRVQRDCFVWEWNGMPPSGVRKLGGF